ncbi:MAG: hypothetical protein AAFR17_05550 [Pseudomonadota bacterium]
MPHRLSAILGAAALLIAPATFAEEPTPPGPSPSLKDQLTDQLGTILRDLTEEVRPAFDEMMESLGFLEEIDSFEHYGAPEVLPNGDILIPRREDAPPYTPPELEADPAPAAPPPPEPGIRT